MCYALRLLTKQLEGDPDLDMVSSLNLIWEQLRSCNKEFYRVLPAALTEHLGIEANIIAKRDLFALLFNHLKMPGREEVFSCKLEAPFTLITLEVAAASRDLLHYGIGAKYPFSSHMYLDRANQTRMPKRAHESEGTDPDLRKCSRTSVITRTAHTEVPSQLEEVMSLPEEEVVDLLEQSAANTTISTLDVTEEIQRYDQVDHSFNMQQAKALSNLAALDQPVTEQSISEQMSKMLEEKKVDQLRVQLKLALEDIAARIKRVRSNQDEGIEVDSGSEDTADDQSSVVEVMNVDNTIITIAEVHDHPSTSHVKPSAPPSSSPMLQKNSFTENYYSFPPEEDLWKVACETLEFYKEEPLNYLNLNKFLLSFSPLPILLSSEIFEQLRRKKSIPLSAKQFLRKNLIKLIYHQSVAKNVNLIDASFICNFENSFEEVQGLCNFRETETFLADNEKLREGPSTLSITRALIPRNLLVRKSAILVGCSSIYRNLFIPNQRYLYDEFINLSGPMFMNYNTKLDSDNQLYVYLLETIGQLGSQDFTPIIMVEFYFRKYEGQDSFEAMIQMAKDFIFTLEAVQLLYKGKIICISPPPYWCANMSISKYQALKFMSRKCTEALNLFGYAKNIFCSNPIICSVPIFSPEKPEAVGFLCDELFEKVPLFTKNGEYTAEACRRALRGLRSDLRMLRKYEL